jgi:hypothetical protein
VLAWLATASVMGAAAWLLAVATVKLSDLAVFEGVLVRQGLVPRWAAPVVATGVAIGECIAGACALVCVLCGRVRQGAAIMTGVFVLLACYAAVLTIRPPATPTPCGCGVSGRPVERWWPIAARNAGIAMLFGGFAVLCTYRVAGGRDQECLARQGVARAG